MTAPSLDLPNYTVLNRLPGGEATADVLIPSLSRGDERRQEICRAVAATESLEMAFFFSTEDALEAHQAHLPSPDERDALKAGDSPGTGAGWRVHAGGGRLSGLRATPRRGDFPYRSQVCPEEPHGRAELLRVFRSPRWRSAGRRASATACRRRFWPSVRTYSTVPLAIQL